MLSCAFQLLISIRDANATFNFEVSDSITTSMWHSDVSYELQVWKSCSCLALLFLMIVRSLRPSLPFSCFHSPRLEGILFLLLRSLL